MKKQPKAEPKALRVIWDVRNASGDGITTYEAIMCPAHRDRLFTAMPNSHGNNEWFPVEQCDLCTGRKHFAAGFKWQTTGRVIAL